MNISQTISDEFKLSIQNTQNIIELIEQGNTIPFIARYRKEMTGAIDDQVLRELNDRLNYLKNLVNRKEEITNLINSQGKLTDELASEIEQAISLTELDDIYRPYRPKRKTRASVAKEKGLEPLSEIILLQQELNKNIKDMALEYVNEEKGVNNTAQAINGAMDIIAEKISDDAQIRRILKNYINRTGNINSVKVKDEESVYEQYYDFREPIIKTQSHRILALNRGEKEGFLKVTLEVDDLSTKQLIYSRFVKGKNELSEIVKSACDDAYNRLIQPSLQREIRNSLTETANEQAIKTFSLNLKPLLMQRPVKNKVVLGFDPAFRTGCKLAVVDETGKVLETAVIYPTAPHNKTEESKKKLLDLIKKYNVKVISLGNGTASRESENFIADVIKGTDCSYVTVSEAGASVYSASKLAAKEFPDYDVSLRSAVSIARRLEDPLAELVKIDPKSIGIGQYQHDMPPQRLSQALDGVVEDCVNSVGADINTASPSLLSHISGINTALCENIVKYREENGAFKQRKDLLKVSKFGKKAYEQSAGFLRVAESENILDNTGVHPESYEAAKKLLLLCSYTLEDVKTNNLFDINKRVSDMGKEKLAMECGIGVPTLSDIIFELTKPGRDPRDDLSGVLLRKDVMSIDDLQVGMQLTGTVRNVVDFGAFVDIGVHQDGLVHISQLSDKFVVHPSDIVKTGDVVKVKVTDVQASKNRISLSMVF